MPQFGVEYRHAGKSWMTTYYAEDIEDARAKLRSMATNGEVMGPVYTAPVPGFLPPWFVVPILSLVCMSLNVASWLKRQFRSQP